MPIAWPMPPECTVLPPDVQAGAGAGAGGAAVHAVFRVGLGELQQRLAIPQVLTTAQLHEESAVRGLPLELPRGEMVHALQQYSEEFGPNRPKSEPVTEEPR